MVTIEDCVEAEEIVKADPGIRRLLKERYGLTDMSMVAADPWFYGDRFRECPAPHVPSCTYTDVQSTMSPKQVKDM
jgi:Cu2+-containing amine oxidase